MYLAAADCWVPPGWSSLPRALLALSLAAFLCSAAAVANAASTDATLSALALKDRDGATVALSPGFSASTTSYTASVPARVARITIEATKGDDGARVDYLDGAESALTDADTVADHFQVDLGAGANTIKVKVTAEDTVNTTTYTLVVTRATPMASADALLSNLDESNDVGIVVAAPADASTVAPAQAIRFQTGSSERGYYLTSVKAILADASDWDGVRVRIYSSRSNGTPYLSLYTLSNPAISDGTLTFTAPASAYLKKGSRYFVVFDSTASGSRNDYEIRGTESESLNSAEDGWSLNADRHVGTPDSTSWSTSDEVPLIEISGDAVIRSNDATLSALSVKDGTPRFVTLMSPSFDSSMTSYTSSAAALVDQITIKGTATNADGATVAYLDGDDQLLTDADVVEEGFQVDLEVGENTIKVRVTAEDGSTTRTYTVVVTRAEPLASPDALLSNLDERNVTSLYAGTPTNKIRWTLAIGFETGSNEGGYTLTSVKGVVSFNTASSGMRVRIFSSSEEGRPENSLYTLSSTTNNIGVRTFEAPADATLESDTSYFVVFDTANTRGGKYYKLRGTISEFVNSAAAGWSLDDDSHTQFWSVRWIANGAVPFVEINGDAVVPSSDAALSGLGLTWDDGGTDTDIALNPTFDASKTAYTAVVGNGVDRITIAGTKSDSGARVDYFDGSDTALTDADGNAAGFQVNLGIGANTIKAKVAASDGETTRTYTVVVTRAVGDTTAPTATGATVNGATLVISFNEALAAAANLANGAFAVKKTPSGGSEETITLSGSPSISGATVTLTLATPVVSTDTVTVSYTRPTTGTANTLQDIAGNEVADFADRAVTNETQATLTAWFQNAPDEHDGSSVFTIELAFSEAVFDGSESFDRNQAIQDALQVTGGAVAGRRRVAPTVYDRWLLRIRPSGDGDVTVRLPATTSSCGTAGAICTPDGRPLSMPASATIEGPSAEAPDAPSAPTLTAGETWLEASWTAPDDNGSAITGYDVHYRETGGNWQDAGHTGTATTKRITGLTADTAYEVRVRASNSEGAGDWSPAASARTDAAAEAPDAPSAPTLTVGETWIEASWTAPDDNGAAITGYDVHYRETGGNWTDANHTGTGTTKRIESLTADTAYEVRVRASNDEGAGDWSPSASARTDAAAEKPDAPSAPSLTTGETWLEASWTAPDDNGAAITGYDVHYRETGGNWQDAGHTGTGTTKRIEGLTADTAYEVRVRASNAEGTGDWSPSASGRTDAAEGTADGDVRLVNGGTELEGRLEIYHDGEWGTVCDDRFVSEDAEVVCRQLGYTGGEVRTRAAFGAGSGTIWMDDVRCAGTESRLADCAFAGWGLHNCRHSEDVGVSCGPAAGMSLESATASGAVLTLRFDRALDNGSAPTPGDFVVAANSSTGAAAVPVESVAVAGGAAVLTLSRTVAPRERLSVSYLPAPMHPLQDTSYNPAPALIGHPVVHVPSMESREAAPTEWPAQSMGAAGFADGEKIEVLHLPSRGLADVWPLAAMADLEVLHLGDNAVGDVTALGSLENLRVLDLSGNAVSDLWPLAAVADLEVLDLGDNAVGDITALGSLGHLRVLDLSGNSISDLWPLSGLTALRRLDLSGNRVADLRPLSELRHLEVLVLDGNEVSDLAPLWGLQKLAHLDMGNNRLEDAAPLGEARSLQRLDLADNRLRDIRVLGDLEKLVWLRVSGNPIADFSPLERPTTVRWLVLDAQALGGR